MSDGWTPMNRDTANAPRKEQLFSPDTPL